MGVRGYGTTPEEAFEQAAVALTAIVTEPDAVQPADCVDIACQAPDIELLLVDWLNALVYEMATRRMLFSRYQVHIDNHRLSARACGEGVDIARHQPRVEVKGATYTQLKVAHSDPGAWRVECVVDV